MNPKLKKFLKDVWSEPRSFFLWLTLVLLMTLVAVIVAAQQFRYSAAAALQIAALLLAVGVAVSLVCFALAWIPPIRRLFSRLLERRFFILACLATLIALFYAVENWRGGRAWKSYKQEWEAKGECFELLQLAPPPVPDDQNFFMTPLWEPLQFSKTNDQIVWRDTNCGADHVILSTSCPGGDRPPDLVHWFKAERTDLSEWQSFYRGSNNVFSTESANPTNYFPVYVEPQSPAEDVLLALSRFDENRGLVIEAAARPHARFWINYDDGFAALLPHMAKLKASSIYLSVHSVAAMNVGGTETAFEDVKLSFRLMDAIRDEPILISHLVRASMLQTVLQPVWEGLADQVWSDSQLSALETEFRKLDFLADHQLAMRGERAFGIWAVDYVEQRRLTAANEILSFDDDPETVDIFGGIFGSALVAAVPGGWFDRNRLSLCRIHTRYLMLMVDQEQRLVPPAASRRAEDAIEERTSHLSLFDLFSRMLLPSLTRPAKRFAHAQACTDLARVAVALERYRLTNGEFPESLDSLVPDFLQDLPHDIINGEPLQYRRRSNGQFVLYSVGWNETDDDGEAALNKSGRKPDISQGDWVWRYPDE